MSRWFVDLHVLVSHIPEFLKLYGSITSFSQQGLEKLNDNITKSYFRYGVTFSVW